MQKPHQFNKLGHRNQPFDEIISCWIGIKKSSIRPILLSMEEKTFPVTLASLPKKIRVAHLPA